MYIHLQHRNPQQFQYKFEYLDNAASKKLVYPPGKLILPHFRMFQPGLATPRQSEGGNPPPQIPF
jgi:hypothetical protein